MPQSLPGSMMPIVITKSGTKVDEKGVDPKSPDSMGGMMPQEAFKSNETEMRVTEVIAHPHHGETKDMSVIFNGLD